MSDMGQKSISELRAVANEAADAAGEILGKYFRSPLELENKYSLSPVVTKADLEVEMAMREIIGAAFPDHAIIGEEMGEVPGKGGGDSAISWVLDPLDGTIAFVCGKPTFVTLIGVYDAEVPLLGVIDQPTLDERWIGGKGMPTELNGQACAVSGNSALGEARLGTSDPAYLLNPIDQQWFQTLRQNVCITSCGGDGYAYALLASGHIDLLVEDGLAWHDAAAIIPVIESAGGVVTDFSGRPLQPRQKSYEVIAAATRELLDAALALRTG